ncbi:PHP domain-containing protein [Streptomyces sp. L7]|uniref:PHP domain-containing protein n=1 Tax=Streptomyces sp. L7 TaxID=3423954 RepID=UPI003D965E84
MADERRFSGPVDLHAHSSVSDGTETPAELVRAAAAAGIGTVALTDHDSTSGWASAAAAAAEAGVTVIPGMELSTRVEFASVHMLGYLFDPADEALVAETRRIREGRMRRAEDMVRRIAEDYDITWADVLDQATEGATVGRPHIADALVARGLAADRSAAFAGILHWRSGYFQPHYAPDPMTGIRLIRGAGEFPCWRTRRPAAAASSPRTGCAGSSAPGCSGWSSTTARTGRRVWRCCAGTPPSTASRSPAPATTTGQASPTGSARTPPIRPWWN